MEIRFCGFPFFLFFLRNILGFEINIFSKEKREMGEKDTIIKKNCAIYTKNKQKIPAKYGKCIVDVPCYFGIYSMLFGIF